MDLGNPGRAFRPPRSGTHRARPPPPGDRRGRNFGPASFSAPQGPSGCGVEGRRGRHSSPATQGALPEICQKLRYAQPRAAPHPSARQRLSGPLPARLPRPDHRPTPPPWPTARTRHGAGRGGRRGTGGGAGQCTRAWLSSSERPRCRPSMIDQNREQFMGSLAGHCRPCSSAVRATSIRCCCSASSANL